MSAPNHEISQQTPAGISEREMARRALQRRAAEPLANALAYRIADACRMGGFGRTKCYELIDKGELKTVKVGNRRLIVGDSLRARLAA